MGRRKFLSPLYEALVKTPEGKRLALDIYREARPAYHPLAQDSIERILGLKEGGGMATTDPSMEKMNAVAEQYVRLVLAMGEHDKDFVDAYYGPEEWRDEVKAEKKSLGAIRTQAAALLAAARALEASDEMAALRKDYLVQQLESLIARNDVVSGKKMTFDQEAKAIYDAEPPHLSTQYFDGILAQLEKLVPGTGALSDRLERHRQQFIIPKDKLDTVFKEAIRGCRERTLRHIDLPAGESFTIEYVTDKSWSGYNWYQGGYKSLIQVNTDLPIYIDRAIDLACHEGYPGHHVYNVLLEKNLARDRGWVEFMIYPLFSSQSLIAEGTANYGIQVAFPAEERVEYERKHLFPLAGIDPAKAERYYDIQELTEKLNYAGNEAARRYLNGEINADQAADFLTRYALMSPDRARQRVRFIDQYRAYVINYNLGKDLVREYIESGGGTADNPEKRWEIFEQLLSSPRLPSGLKR